MAGGLLVHGDNHFIVRGPRPDLETARALVRRWSIIGIGPCEASPLDQWRISTREFREDLEWAIVVPGESEMSRAVVELLGELEARGVRPEWVHAGDVTDRLNDVYSRPEAKVEPALHSAQLRSLDEIDSLDELAEVRETLRSRYDDLKSGKVRPIAGEEVEAWLREKSAAARRLKPGS